MKILHVATYVFPDAFGGAERFIHGLARAQAAAGHEVTVLTGNTGGLAAEERLDGFRVRRYPLPDARGLGFFRGVGRQVDLGLRDLAGEGFDFLHAHQIASAVPALDARFPARKLMTFHASYQLEFEAERLDGAPAGAGRSLPLADRLKSMAIGMLDRRCLSRAERITTLSRFVVGQIEALLPSARERVRVVPPGQDFERFAPGDRAGARQAFSIPQDALLIVTVRRLVRRMGIDILLQAAARLASRGLDVQVVIGGAGAEREALEALRAELGLGERVTFLGRVPDDRLPDLLRAADLFVLPTRSMEGFGMVTIEALACGTPVVATDTGGTPEILAPIDPALLAAPNPDAMASAIERLLRDATLRRELGARGAESVRARYAWPTVVANVDRVYRDLLQVPAHA